MTTYFEPPHPAAGKSSAICTNCGDPFSTARLALGYTTCLPCGDEVAKTIRHLSAPLNKSNYVLITNLTDLKQLNPKRIGE